MGSGKEDSPRPRGGTAVEQAGLGFGPSLGPCAHGLGCQGTSNLACWRGGWPLRRVLADADGIEPDHKIAEAMWLRLDSLANPRGAYRR